MADKPKKGETQETSETPEVETQTTETELVQEETPKVEDLQAKIVQLETDKEGMADQLKEQRRKKQEAEALLVEPKKVEKVIEGEDETDKKVRLALAKERETEVKDNRIKALHKFWEGNPEFNPENDIAGVRMDQLNQVLKSRFNVSKSRSVGQLLGDYQDAVDYMNKGKEKTQTDTSNPADASSPAVSTTPKVIEGGKLTSEQEKLRKEKGWSVEKYLKLKEKHPDIVV